MTGISNVLIVDYMDMSKGLRDMFREDNDILFGNDRILEVHTEVPIHTLSKSMPYILGYAAIVFEEPEEDLVLELLKSGNEYFVHIMLQELQLGEIPPEVTKLLINISW